MQKACFLPCALEWPVVGEAEAFFLLPGDTPLIRRHSVKDILQVLPEDRRNPVVYPVFAALTGHPPLISAQCFCADSAHDGTGGCGTF